MACTFDKDLDFGPVVDPCRRPFDFTLVFEEAILTLLPSALGCTWALIVAFTLTRREEKADIVPIKWLRLAKLGGALLVLLLQVSIAILTSLSVSAKTHTTVPAGVFSSLLALLLLVLSYLETSRSYRPSSTIVAYHGFLLLVEAARCRTYWLIQQKPTAILFVASIGLRAALLVLESLRKKTTLDDTPEAKSQEEMAGIVNRSFFQWLMPMLLRGYRRDLTCDDLGPVDNVMYSASLEAKFAPLLGPRDRLPPQSLVRQTFECLRYDLLYPVVPRLALIAFKIAQLFVVQCLLQYLQDGVSSPISHGYGLIGACAFTYIGISVVTGWYYHQVYRCSSIARGGLVLAIFSKMLRLREDPDTESRAMTLMVSDVQRISMGFVYIHEIWAAVIEAAIFTYLLQDSMGLTSLCVLGLAVACMLASSAISRITSQQQQVWLRAVQKRLAATQKMLSALKAIKMMGMEKRVYGLVSGLRVDEMAAAKLFRTLLAVSAMLSYATLTLSPLLVFGAYLGVTGLDSAAVDAPMMFTSLVLIALLASPLIHLFQALPTLGAAYGCFHRLQDFLSLQEQPQPLLTSEPRPGHDASADDDDNVLVSVKGASFGYVPDKQPILCDVDLVIQRGKHVAVLGAVGTGKSLLLKSILGESYSLSDGGRLDMRTDSVAYCSQKPWLENISAEANWKRHAHSRDARWMARVAHACALDDIVNLPDYSSGTVGSGGSRLSGGQRQRLALARALVLQREVLLLDDVFSALDPATKSKIFHRLLGPRGLARSCQITVVFTTHDRSLIGLSDEAYEIDGEGHLIPIDATAVPQNALHQSEEHIDNLELKDDTAMFEMPTTNDGEKGAKSPSVNSAVSEATKKRDTKSETISDREVYMTYARSMGLPHAFVFLVAGIVFSITLKLPDLWVKWWTDALSTSEHRPNKFWLGIYGLLTTSPLLVLAIWVLHLMLIVVPISGISLHGDLLGTVLGASFPYISRVDTGHLVNRFNQDLMFVDTQLPMALFNTSAEMFTGLVQIVLVAVASLHALSVIPPLLAVLYMIQRFYLRTSKRLRLLELDTKGDLHTKFAETAAGITTIRAHKWITQAQERFAKSLDSSQEPFYLLYSVQRWLQLVMDLLVAGLVLVVTGVAVGLNKAQQQPGGGDGAVTVGAIGVALTNATSLGQTLTNFIISWTTLETTLGAVARISLFKRNTRLEPKPEIDAPTNSRSSSKEDSSEVATVWPERGTLQLTNVWASYNTTDDAPNAQGDSDSPEFKNGTWSLRGVSATFGAGSKVAICGPTGSGKSTVLLALLGMIDISAGSITVDGVPTSHVSPAALRQRFDVVSQDYFTCGETVRDELDPDAEFSDEQLCDALRECGLWDKLVMRHAAGKEAAGESQILTTRRNDLSLSGGEVQLLCLARVLLRSSKHSEGILLLDEATSSVDSETDEMIHRLLFEKLGQKTILAVSHRPETATRFEEIIVMDQGVIADRGKAADVVQRCDLFSKVRT